MIAPETADARMSAPVFRACIARSDSASTTGRSRPSGSGVTDARVDGLASDHAHRTGGMRNRLDNAEFACGDERVATRGRARQEMKRLGQQSVSSQDGHAFSGDDVQRGRPRAWCRCPSRQVVVDEE
jgi:hypothetical protein